LALKHPGSSITKVFAPLFSKSDFFTQPARAACADDATSLPPHENSFVRL
jgi:hypothetical protein